MNIIHTRLAFTNPWDRWYYFRNLGSVSGMLFKHTAWELEHTYYSPLLLDFELQWNYKTDHAGLELGVGIVGYGVHFRIHDTRHWNYATDSWETGQLHDHFETNS